MHRRPGLVTALELTVAIATAGALSIVASDPVRAASTSHRFHLTATLEPRFVVPISPAAPREAVGTFSMKLNANWHRGAGVWVHMTFTGLSGPPTSVHIHAGRSGERGPALLSLVCGRACREPTGQL